ncbi:MAG TPA: response regulator transcription factor [Anaerolineae bacterium]|nr:response regulator transcription factor [Anaerolineae bacterium]
MGRKNVDTSTKILVIEDDPEIIELLDLGLKQHGYQVLVARDGVEGLQLLQSQLPHLVLLDVMMPRMNGWETCRRIRETSDTPIIMLTALLSDQDKVRGLDLGADDYVTKPFSMAELVARIRAALRRTTGTMTRDEVVRIDERLVFDRSQRNVLADGQTVELSPIEYRMLNCFVDNAGRVLTHQSLLTQVWGWEYADETDYLKVYIHHLRKKIETEPSQPRYILTERGLGYRFQIP